jgi:hypothetical protein
MRLGRTAKELEETIDPEEWREWQGFNLLQPFGDQRNDVAAGVIASTIANSNRSKSSTPFSINDFMVEWGKKALAGVVGSSELNQQQIADKTKAGFMQMMAQQKATEAKQKARQASVEAAKKQVAKKKSIPRSPSKPK